MVRQILLKLCFGRRGDARIDAPLTSSDDAQLHHNKIFKIILLAVKLIKVIYDGESNGWTCILFF
jgi:hypothetical protein